MEQGDEVSIHKKKKDTLCCGRKMEFKLVRKKAIQYIEGYIKLHKHIDAGRAFRKRSLLFLIIIKLFFILAGSAVSPLYAQEKGGGKRTGLPIPRFVSLKSNMVNLRQGPSNEHNITFVYKKAGLPVEIIAEYDNWRRIRDSEGTEGWVWHSLLTGSRTALITPWTASDSEVVTIYRRADEASALVARVQPSVIVSVESCDGQWCLIELKHERQEYSGYLMQNKLWGVYPNEIFD